MESEAVELRARIHTEGDRRGLRERLRNIEQGIEDREVKIAGYKQQYERIADGEGSAQPRRDRAAIVPFERAGRARPAVGRAGTRRRHAHHRASCDEWRPHRRGRRPR